MVSGTDSTFGKNREKVSSPMKIGFLDSNRINKEDVQASFRDIDDSEVKWLGPFNIEPNVEVDSFLDNLLNESNPAKGL